VNSKVRNFCQGRPLDYSPQAKRSLAAIMVGMFDTKRVTPEAKFAHCTIYRSALPTHYNSTQREFWNKRFSSELCKNQSF